MTRAQRLTMAAAAATKAAGLAADAEAAARSSHSHDQAAPLAAAGSLWADVARAHAAIAAALPERAIVR